MPTAAEFFSRYRLAALAVLVSAAVHAAVMIGLPRRIATLDDDRPPTYEASLQAVDPEAPPTAARPAPVAKPKPRAARSPHPRSRIAPPPPPPPAEPPRPEPVAAPPVEPTVVAKAEPAKQQ